MEVYNSSASTAGRRPIVDFEIPEGARGRRRKMSVTRLTAAGAEVGEGTTWAGRMVGFDGGDQWD